ncbi:unnamed protein product, partial [Cladocopium goreaui]
RQTLAGQNRSDEKLAVCYEFQHAVDQVQRSVHLALFVSGWIRDVSDFRQPWLEAAKAIRRTPGEKKGPFCYSDSQNMPEPCASYGLIML